MIIANLSQEFGQEYVSGSLFWIKLLLILGLLIILRAFMVGRSLQLAKRLSAFGLFLIMVLLVLFPEASNVIAHKVGVGRGVDLLIYLAILLILLLLVSLWRRIVTLSDTVTKLTRQIAIENAKKPDSKNISAK
jgi:hypothetical protein